MCFIIYFIGCLDCCRRLQIYNERHQCLCCSAGTNLSVIILKEQPKEMTMNDEFCLLLGPNDRQLSKPWSPNFPYGLLNGQTLVTWLGVGLDLNFLHVLEKYKSQVTHTDPLDVHLISIECHMSMRCPLGIQ